MGLIIIIPFREIVATMRASGQITYNFLIGQTGQTKQPSTDRAEKLTFNLDFPAEPPADSEFLSILRISEFFRFI